MMNRSYICARLVVTGKFAYLYASLRRRLLYWFRRDYVERQRKGRTGVCLGQGHCCARTMPWCAYFGAGKCRVYDRQPLFCRIFPIDRKDQQLSGVSGVCAYRFAAAGEGAPR